MKDNADFNKWLEGSPKVIRELGEKITPFVRYRIKSTGQHCSIVSYFEDGTLRVNVDGHESPLLDEINNSIQVGVFGIKPDDLEPIENA